MSVGFRFLANTLSDNGEKRMGWIFFSFLGGIAGLIIAQVSAVLLTSLLPLGFFHAHPHAPKFIALYNAAWIIIGGYVGAGVYLHVTIGVPILFG